MVCLESLESLEALSPPPPAPTPPQAPGSQRGTKRRWVDDEAAAARLSGMERAAMGALGFTQTYMATRGVHFYGCGVAVGHIDVAARIACGIADTLADVWSDTIDLCVALWIGLKVACSYRPPAIVMTLLAKAIREKIDMNHVHELNAAKADVDDFLRREVVIMNRLNWNITRFGLQF